MDTEISAVLKVGVAAYFISWAFLAGFIMMNIVLAILVDSFTEAQASLKCEQATSLFPKHRFFSWTCALWPFTISSLHPEFEPNVNMYSFHPTKSGFFPLAKWGLVPFFGTLFIGGEREPWDAFSRLWGSIGWFYHAAFSKGRNLGMPFPSWREILQAIVCYSCFCYQEHHSIAYG